MASDPDQVSASVTATIAVPVGTVVSFAGNNPPEGWLLCDGSSIAHSTYPNLYELIGGQLPDLRGRFLLGMGSGAGLTGRSLNQIGGEENHTLSVNEMPSHYHTAGIGGGNRDDSPGTGNSEGWASNNTDYVENTSSVGSNWAHNNMPPFYVLTFIIKY